MSATITCGCETPDIETLPVLVARPSGSYTVPGVKMLRCDNCRWAVEVNDTGITRNLNPSTLPTSPKETYKAYARTYQALAPAEHLSVAGDKLWAFENALKSGNEGRIHVAALMVTGFAKRNGIPTWVAAEVIEKARVVFARASTAEALAHVTGSVGATYRVEKREADGTTTVLSEETYRAPIATPELDEFLERSGITEELLDSIDTFIQDNPLNSKREDWTPSAIARKVKCKTWQASMVLDYLVRRGYIRSSGNGAWERYRGGRVR